MIEDSRDGNTYDFNDEGDSVLRLVDTFSVIDSLSEHLKTVEDKQLKFLTNHAKTLASVVTSFKDMFGGDDTLFSSKSRRLGTTMRELDTLFLTVIRVLRPHKENKEEYLELRENLFEYSFFWMNGPEVMKRIRGLMNNLSSVFVEIQALDEVDKDLSEISAKLTLSLRTEKGMQDIAEILVGIEKVLGIISESTFVEELEDRDDSVMKELIKGYTSVEKLRKTLSTNQNKNADDPFQVLNACGRDIEDVAQYLMLNLEKLKSVIPADQIEIGDEIGHGTFGVVFEGSFLSLPVALKTLAGGMERNLIHRRELLQEANEFRNLRHQNVVHFYGNAVLVSSMSGLRSYMVMELCNGSLENVLYDELDNTIIDVDRLKSYFLDCFRGLTFLHRSDIIHRDVKPGNIMLVGPTLKLGDFGLAVKSEGGKEVETYTPHGTLKYLAPEVIDPPAIWTKAADIYAMGIVCYEMITNSRPFFETQANAALELVRRGKRPQWKLMRRTDGNDPVIVQMKKIVELCWQQNLSARPSAQNAYELSDALQTPDFNQTLYAFGRLVENKVRDQQHLPWSVDNTVSAGHKAHLQKLKHLTNKKEVAKMLSDTADMILYRQDLIERDEWRLDMLRDNFFGDYFPQILDKFANDKVIVKAALELIFSLVQYDNHARKEALKYGIHTRVNKLLTETYLTGAPDIVEIGARVLAELTKVEAEVLLEEDFINVFLNNLDTSPRESCYALGNLSKNNEDLARYIVTRKAHIKMISLVQTHTNPEVVAAAIYGLTRLAKAFVDESLIRKEKDKKKKRAKNIVTTASKVVMVCVEAMGKFAGPDKARVQQLCCECISSQLRNNLISVAQILEQNKSMYMAIISSMQANERNQNLIMAALYAIQEALKVQTGATKEDREAHLKFKVNAISKAGGIETIIQSAKTYSDNKTIVSIVLSCCYTFATANDQDILTKMDVAGVVAVATDAMQKFVDGVEKPDLTIKNFAQRVTRAIQSSRD